MWMEPALAAKHAGHRREFLEMRAAPFASRHADWEFAAAQAECRVDD